MSEEINVDEVIRTIQFSEIAQKGYKVMSNDEFDRIVNGVLNLQQENKQLKEQIQDLKADYGTIAQIERDLYKEVIEEVREYMKKNRTRYIYQDNLGVDWWFEDLDVYSELLQILDKGVKDK